MTEDIQEATMKDIFSFVEADLHKLIVHYVGNSFKEEPLNISKRNAEISDANIKGLLSRYFLSNFKDKKFYNFAHETDIHLNEVYTYCTRIFNDPDSFYLQSINLVKHLYAKSTHPKVKGGEVYVVYFKYCEVGGEMVDAIGIFKSENKDTFLKVLLKDDGFEINAEDGININRLDKGCIVFNTEIEKGYKVCIVDTLNKGGEAQYWKDDFLHLKFHEDHHYHTKNYLNLCQNFVADKFKEDFKVSKVDEIDFMNRSVDFFKKKEVFDLNDFAHEVIGQPEIIDSFNDFKKTYQEQNEIKIYDEFNISAIAVKQTSKIYKNIVKLDKNFHIYIHGNKDLIEKGFDEEKGMSFYKVYYNNEH